MSSPFSSLSLPFPSFTSHLKVNLYPFSLVTGKSPFFSKLVTSQLTTPSLSRVYLLVMTHPASPTVTLNSITLSFLKTIFRSRSPALRLYAAVSSFSYPAAGRASTPAANRATTDRMRMGDSVLGRDVYGLAPRGAGGQGASSTRLQTTAFIKWANRPRQARGTSAVSVIGSARVGCRN